MNVTKYRFAPALAAFLLACVPAHAQQAAPAAPAAPPGDDTAGQSASDLAKKLQNPIGDLYSFPFQIGRSGWVRRSDTTSFWRRPDKEHQMKLAIQTRLAVARRPRHRWGQSI
jgi:hypothetical protein